MLKTIKNLKHSDKSSLVRQVLLITFVSVILVFTFKSVLHVINTFEKGDHELVSKTTDLVKTMSVSLEESVWEMNKDSVDKILKVLVSDPNIIKAELINPDLKSEFSNSEKLKEWISLSFPIVHRDYAKETIALGTLKVTLTKDHFYNRLKTRLFFALIEDLFHFLVVGACIVWVLNKKLIIPMSQIREMNDRFTEEHLRPLIKAEETKEKKDSLSELEKLQVDIKVLQDNFLKAFNEQKLSEEARHAAELKLIKEEQSKALSQRLETIGQITAQVSHDFANLIMIINNKARFLQKNLQKEEDIKHLEVITKTTVRAQSLCKKLLSLTRLQKEECLLFDPYQSLIDMEDLIRMSVGGNIEFSISSSGERFLAELDRSSFENAIINLCVNARDAMPSGGKLQIAFGRCLKNNVDYIMVEVKDTGTGIPSELQEKIFDAYFTTKAMGKGTGLGLAQVQEFVKKAEGFLELNSNDHGTCFTIYIPNKLKDIIAA